MKVNMSGFLVDKTIFSGGFKRIHTAINIILHDKKRTVSIFSNDMEAKLLKKNCY